MNIFVVDTNPKAAATQLADKHVSKMVLESAQMLSTALHRHEYNDSFIYKPGYAHHPCTLWAGESRSNFSWLVRHAEALYHEKCWRMGGCHKSFKDVIEPLLNNNAEMTIPDIGLTPFVLAMPEIYKSDDPTEAYRSYYINEKLGAKRMGYTRRHPPSWAENVTRWRPSKEVDYVAL